MGRREKEKLDSGFCVGVCVSVRLGYFVEQSPIFIGKTTKISPGASIFFFFKI